VKKTDPRYYSLKKIEKELDSINAKILDCYDRHTSFQRGIDSISISMKKLHDKKTAIRTVLHERKQLTKNIRTIAKLQKLMKK